MPEALAKVKASFGNDAVILGTRWVEAKGLRGLTSGKMVEITASSGQPEPQGATRETSVPGHLREPYQRLTAAAVSESLAKRLLAGQALERSQSIQTVRAQFQTAVERLIPTAGEIQLRTDRATCVALLGPAGAGKTTTTAKLAAEFVLRRGVKVALVSLDLHGVGRHDQLARYAELIGADHYAPQSLEAAEELRPQLASADLILLDTSGLGPRDIRRRDQLKEILDIFRPDERHLVLPASMEPGVQSRFADFFSGLSPNRLLMTRVDEAIGLGVVLNTAERLSLALSYTSGGQTVPHDLQPASPAQLSTVLGNRSAYSDATAQALRTPAKISTSAVEA